MRLPSEMGDGTIYIANKCPACCREVQVQNIGNTFGSIHR